MKVGVNMEIYKGYYSDKKYQFIYNIEDIKKIVKPIFDEYKVNHVLLFGSYARNEASLISDITSYKWNTSKYCPFSKN